LTWSSRSGETFLIRVGGSKEVGYGEILVTCGGDVVLGDSRVLVPSVNDGGTISKYLLKDSNYIDIVKDFDFYSSVDGVNLTRLDANITDIKISDNGLTVDSSGEFYVNNNRITWTSLSSISNSDQYPPHSYVVSSLLSSPYVLMFFSDLTPLFSLLGVLL